jgi:phosphatidylserine/phosphatidylglycerophosphate/cardiolipin synthase-like enzyme
MSTLAAKCSDTTGRSPESLRMAARIASLEAQRTNALTQKDSAHADLLASQLRQAREEQAQALRNQAAVLRVEQQQAIQQNQQAEATRIAAEIERVRAEQHQAFQAQLALIREELERAAQAHQQQQAQEWTHQLDALRGQRDQAILDLGEQLRADHARALLQHTTQSALQLQLQLDAARAERGEVLDAQRRIFEWQNNQIRQELRDAVAENRREIAAALGVQLLAMQNGRDQALAELGNRLRAEQAAALAERDNQFAAGLNAAIANNLAEQERIRAQAQQDYEQQRALLVQEQADARANQQRALQDAAEAQLLALQIERENDLQALGDRLRHEHEATLAQQRQAVEALANQQRVASEEQQRLRDAEIARLQQQLDEANNQHAVGAAGLAAQLIQVQHQRDEERAHALAEANRLREEQERVFEGQRQQAAAQLAAQAARIEAEHAAIQADQERAYGVQLAELLRQRAQTNIQAQEHDATIARLNALLRNRDDVLERLSNRLRAERVQALEQQREAAEQQRLASEEQQRRFDEQIADLQQRLAHANANNQQGREAIQAQLLQAQDQRAHALGEANRLREEHQRALLQQEQRAAAQLEREQVIRAEQNEVHLEQERLHAEEVAELRRELEGMKAKPLDETQERIRGEIRARLLAKEQARSREVEAQSIRVEAELALSHEESPELKRNSAEGATLKTEQNLEYERQHAQLLEELAEDRRNNNGRNQVRIETIIRELDEKHVEAQRPRTAQLTDELEHLRVEQKKLFDGQLRLLEDLFKQALRETNPDVLRDRLESILDHERELFDRRGVELSGQLNEARFRSDAKRTQHLEEEAGDLQDRKEAYIQSHARMMDERIADLERSHSPSSVPMREVLENERRQIQGAGLSDSLLGASHGPRKTEAELLEEAYRKTQTEIDRLAGLVIPGDESLLSEVYRTLQAYNGARENETWGVGKESSFTLADTPRYADEARTQFQPDHTAAMKNGWSQAITSGTRYIDITTLSEPDSGFFGLLKSSINALAQKSKQLQNAINVRIIYATIPGLRGLNAAVQNIDTDRIVKDLVADFHNDKEVKLNISVGTYDASSFKWLSWNHSKIVASDSDILFTGGHNLYNDYLIYDSEHPEILNANNLASPIHDLSVGLRGRGAALVAHKFINGLWRYIAERSSVFGNIIFHGSSGKAHTFKSGTGQVQSCYKQKDCFLPDFDAPIAEPEFGGQEARDVKGKAEDVQEHDFLSVGRLGFLKQNDRLAAQDKTGQDYLYRNVSDAAILDLISQARYAIFLAQQRLEPLSVAGLRQTNRFNSAVYEALASKIYDGKHVYILISSNDPLVSGRTAFNYLTDSSITSVMRDFTNLVKKYAPKGHPEVARSKVLRFLHILPTANGNSEVPNHSKVVIADNRGVYVGSSNTYDNSHTEFGIIEDEIRATEILKQWYIPLWKASLRYWLTHKRLDGKDPKFIK